MAEANQEHKQDVEVDDAIAAGGENSYAQRQRVPAIETRVPFSIFASIRPSVGIFTHRSSGFVATNGGRGPMNPIHRRHLHVPDAHTHTRKSPHTLAPPQLGEFHLIPLFTFGISSTIRSSSRRPISCFHSCVAAIYAYRGPYPSPVAIYGLSPFNNTGSTAFHEQTPRQSVTHAARQSPRVRGPCQRAVAHAQNLRGLHSAAGFDEIEQEAP